MKVREVSKVLSEVNEDVEVRISDDDCYFQVMDVEYDPIRDQVIVTIGEEDNDIG